MAKRKQSDASGLHYLSELLERALDGNADSLELEYNRGELEIYFRVGNTGIGDVITDPELQDGLYECIVKMANLKSKNSGRFTIPLKGKDYTILVKQSESFGEPVFSLRFAKSKGKRK